MTMGMRGGYDEAFSIKNLSPSWPEAVDFTPRHSSVEYRHPFAAHEFDCCCDLGLDLDLISLHLASSMIMRGIPSNGARG